MARFLIIEDEPPAARRLGVLIAAYRPEASITVAPNLSEAREKVRTSGFDVICLDLNLQGADGFSILDELSSQSAVIVISAYEERAIEAFEHGVRDFVPKPVAASRLHLAIDRALEHIAPTDRNLALRSAKGIEIVPLADISAVIAVENYTEVHLLDGRTFVDDRSLAAFEKICASEMMRVHRSHLLNTANITELVAHKGSWLARLKSGETYAIARRKVRAVKDALTCNTPDRSRG